MKQYSPWIAAVALACLSGCNYSVGECMVKGEESGSAGAGSSTGSGDPVPPGGGDTGAAPPKQPQDAPSDSPPPPVCNSIGSYDSSLFRFTTIVADDGNDEAGGYQGATASSVKFVDGRQDLPTAWTCSVTVKMPLRTKAYGKVSANRAADISADVLTDASSITMHSRSSWIKSLFCIKLADNMNFLFGREYDGLGAQAAAQ
jgi:hypothetical protein